MQLKRLTAAFVFLAAAVLGFAQTGFKPSWATPKKVASAAALQGVWTMTSIGGEAVSPNDPPLKIEFRSGNSDVGDYLITRGADEVEAGEFRLTDTPTGLQIDFGPGMGDNAGKIQHGILKVEDTKLTWCMSPAGSENRPTAFANITATAESEGTTVIEAVKANTKKAAAAKPAPPSTPAPSLLQSIQGNWDRADGYTYSFDGNAWTLSKASEVVARGWISLDESLRPARVVSFLEWSKSGSSGTFYGIMDLNGNTLRRCTSPLGTQTPPSAFETNEINHNYLETMTRAASIRNPDHEPDMQTQLQGSWRVQRMLGQAVPSDKEMMLSFSVNEYRMTASSGGNQEIMEVCNFVLRPSSTAGVWEVDLVVKSGEFRGETSRGLVAIEGNQLRLCVPADGVTTRPQRLENAFNGEKYDSVLFEAERL